MARNPEIQKAKRIGALWSMLEAKPAADKAARAMVRDSKRRMKGTNLGKLQALQAERQRWERKQTIAGNKLREVRRAIETLAEDMARKTVETEWEGKTNG